MPLPNIYTRRIKHVYTSLYLITFSFCADCDKILSQLNLSAFLQIGGHHITGGRQCYTTVLTICFAISSSLRSVYAVLQRTKLQLQSEVPTLEYPTSKIPVLHFLKIPSIFLPLFIAIFQFGNLSLLLPCACNISAPYSGCQKQFYEMKDAVFYVLCKIHII